MSCADSSPDSDLVKRFIGGDVTAFETLVARYEKPIFNFVRRTVGPREEVEDITQETFIRVYQRVNNLRDVTSFRSWLWAIAVNLCKDHAKRLRYRSHLSIEDSSYSSSEPACAVSVDRQLEDAETKAIVDKSIRALRPDIRMVVVLREYVGLSYQKIAQAVGCPLGTVKSRLFLARQELRKNLGFLLDEIKEGGNL